MHTKTQLESMTMDQLLTLAQKIGAEKSNDKTTLIYNIIDAESIVGPMNKESAPAQSRAEDAKAADAEPAPKKRGRKPKAEKEMTTTQPSRGEEIKEPEASIPTESAEPAPKKRGRKPKSAKEETPEPTLQEEKVATKDATEEPAEPAPKKRGRKPKAEKETGTAFRIIRDIRPVAQILADIQNNIAAPAANAPAAQQDNRRPQRPTYNFGDKIIAEGVLELDQSHGRGFLRSSDYNYMPSPDDIVVTAQQIKNMGLKTGDVIRCSVNMPNPGEAYYNMGRIHSINGCDPRVIRDRSPFESLTPLFPDEKFNLCTGQNDPLSVRIVDLFAPIGKGQRALIVAQPKTGKTILMKEIANAIAKNHPEAYLMMLLVDERPEEVTDMARTVKAEVIASTFDEPAERHVRIAGIVLEKAKRMVECGHDVVIFLDSITRLARAYNTVAPSSGKVLSGGVEATAMHKPKRFFGAARNIEGGGSLTIIATALTDTGSKMDEVIFEEFKGTGNMELQLDRMLANKRIFPAVNIVQSSTRRDDLLQDRMTLDRMWILRKFLTDMNPIEAMTEMKQRIQDTKTNEEFLQSMNS